MLLRSSLFAVLLLLLPLLSATAEDDHFFQVKVLSHLRQALQQYDSVDLTATVNVPFAGSTNPEIPPFVRDTVVRIRRLGPRALISMKHKTVRPGKDPWLMQNDAIVFDNGDVLSCQASLDSSLRPVKSIDDNLSFILCSERLAGTQERDSRTVYYGLNDYGAVLWFIGYAPLLDYIDEASELTIKQTDDGAEIYATSPYGHLTLSLSNSHGWLPQSLKIVKEPEHQLMDKRIRDLEVQQSVDGSEDSIESIAWTVEVGSFTRNVDDRWAPSQMAVTRNTTYSSALQTIKATIDFEYVRFDPPLTKSDFRTDIVAPAGYRVTVNDANHLKYIWDGEKPVPGEPISREVLVAQLESARERKQRTLLIAVNVAIVSALVFFVWRKRAMA